LDTSSTLVRHGFCCADADSLVPDNTESDNLSDMPFFKLHNLTDALCDTSLPKTTVFENTKSLLNPIVVHQSSKFNKVFHIITKEFTHALTARYIAFGIVAVSVHSQATATCFRSSGGCT
jgi:hypothetical protein